MGVGCRELIAADEPPVVAEPLFDTIVMEDSQNDGGLSDSSGPNQSDWCEVLCGINNLLNQLVAPKAGPRRWRWQFPGYAG